MVAGHCVHAQRRRAGLATDGAANRKVSGRIDTALALRVVVLTVQSIAKVGTTNFDQSLGEDQCTQMRAVEGWPHQSVTAAALNCV